jgi:hypothetical protein
MNYRNLLFSICLMTVFGLSCASVSTVKNAPLHVGKNQAFPADFDTIVEAASQAMVEAGLEIDSRDEIDKDTYMIVGKKSSSAFSWGELVRVVVVRKESAETEVRVHSKRRVAANITAKGDYSDQIFAGIEYRLKKDIH